MAQELIRNNNTIAMVILIIIIKVKNNIKPHISLK